MERLPDTARKLDEEAIRDLGLFILNANYEGAASGEVFNGAGKTDILLNHDGRAAFIGEFKFWGGPKAFSLAIDQLLAYTTWRDTKAALILLIKDVRATTAIDGADKTIREHPQFQSANANPFTSGRRSYVLASNTDPFRSVSVALLPVVIPDPREKTRDESTPPIDIDAQNAINHPDVIAIRQSWIGVVSRLNRRSKRIAVLARDVRIVGLRERTLILGCKSSVLARMIEDHAGILTEAIEEELNLRLKLECQVPPRNS
ncbi:hypothetical protein [Micromonospora sp. DT231]|uniref:hypothetical protein n=1 Tax=Micromonospora sp. DT231 TaxID=3416526 RepID=UPI003CF55B35